MGRVAEKVKIDVEYIDDYRKQRGISSSEFSKQLGFCNNWWSKNSQHGYIKVNVAKLMCALHPALEYNKLVIQEVKPVQPVAEETSGGLEDEYLPLIAAAMGATSNALHEVNNALERLNEKMDAMLALWK